MLYHKPAVFNLFHAATHFATQFNLTIPFRKFPVRHMKCSCVCTIENHSDWKITYDITMLNKDSFVKMMHMAASVRETRVVYKTWCKILTTPTQQDEKTRTESREACKTGEPKCYASIIHQTMNLSTMIQSCFFKIWIKFSFVWTVTLAKITQNPYFAITFYLLMFLLLQTGFD